jgi:ribosomal-protein-alanine N-acetyltransferase
MNIMVKYLPEQLQTARLVLREPCETDARFLFEAYTQDPDVSRYMVWRPHTALFETEAFITESIQDWKAQVRRPYILTTHQNIQLPIGILEARALSHIVDIGYVLARPYWGQGLMPEAVCALTETVLASPHFFRVQATCDIENRASARTLEKSGFTREGRLERYLMLPNISPEPRPSYFYARCR